MGAFKAYDIRGVYGKDITEESAYRIGYFLPGLLAAKKVLVGRDVRLSSESLFRALCRGITDSDADVYDLGLSTTPFVYFCTARYGFDASVQITASHNPKEYNGFKVSRTGALPVGYETGLADLEKRVMSETPAVPSPDRGKIIPFDKREDYIEFFRAYIPETDLKIAVDCSNGMASLFIKDILGQTPVYINDELDGSFPNHEPNPLEEKNTEQLSALVKRSGSDIGIIYDGDADRVVFTDERGGFISPDLIVAVMGHYFLEREQGNVLHDIRTSKSVSEYVKALGGTPHMWKVGHAFAKLKLRELKAVYGGELAGHYYFRDFFNCDSGILASLIVLTVVGRMKKKGETFSSLIGNIVRYAYSGEINFRIEKKDEAMNALRSQFTKEEKPIAVYDFDGYRIEFSDWWFNVRPSNTEPYLRLVVEARDAAALERRLGELRAVLASFQ